MTTPTLNENIHYSGNPNIINLKFDPQPYNTVTFHNSGEEVGRLFVENGTLKFKGNVDKSAKEFFNVLINMWDTHITQNLPTDGDTNVNI